MRKIKQEGLSDIYEIVPVGVEDLGSRWVREGEVDSILTVSRPRKSLRVDTDFTLGPMPLFSRQPKNND